MATLFRRMLRSECGNATVEFVIALPVVLTLWFAATETGLLAMRGVMLERAVDIAMRDLRLGRIANPTHDNLKKAICDHTVIFADCLANMLIELQPISTTSWVMPSLKTDCIDRAKTIQPSTTYNIGAASEIMLVRVCAIVDPIFPGEGIGRDLNIDGKGGYGLLAISAFVNEP